MIGLIKKIVTLLFILALDTLVFQAQAHAPLLVDLSIAGTIDAPTLEPASLQLLQGQEYLLVIKNDNPYPVTFHFDKLGQSINTQYLQGTPSVSQDRVDIPTQTK